MRTRFDTWDDGDGSRRDPFARRAVQPRRVTPRDWLGPVATVLLGLGILAAIVVLWLRLVPIMPGRQRPPVELSSIPTLLDPTQLMPIAPEAARALNSKRPLGLAGPLPAVSSFRFSGTVLSRERAIACLAAAGWYEAGDGVGGQRAVMQTVLNRARHKAFRPTVCGVVFQGSERSTGCQFTFTCDGSMRRTPSPAAWARATASATFMMDGDIDARVGAATHYHADYVLPYWASSLLKLSTVGQHIFYTWPGRWGSPAILARVLGTPEPAISAMAGLAAVHGADATAEEETDPAIAAREAATVPLAPAGIGDRTLRGATVRGAQQDEGRFFIQVDAGTFAGNHAVAALALCKGRSNCRVYGWSDAALIASALPLAEPQRAGLTFFYAHDKGQSDRVLWNCAQVARANADQCLPAAATARAAVTG